jgi:S-disulfanyl-L-cysteine oxidoreductase SoxD
MSRTGSVILVAAALGLFSLGVALAVHAPGAAHFADADDAANVKRGKVIYMGHCASCHGRNLQGQPLWQLTDEFAGRRAPAHDQTGRTWQHSDEDIFHMIKYGRFTTASVGAVSFMPAFRDVLDDRDIIAVTAFIKARWPTALRVSQAMLNPGRAGMPERANETEWRFPPTSCGAARRQQSVAAGATSAAAAEEGPGITR